MSYKYYRKTYSDDTGLYRYFLIDDSGRKWVLGSTKHYYLFNGDRLTNEIIDRIFHECVVYFEPYPYNGGEVTAKNLISFF